MSLTYSKHAKRRMEERSIKESEILECIEMPDYNISKGETKESYKSLEKGNLKVVWKEKNNFIKIITVMWK